MSPREDAYDPHGSDQLPDGDLGVSSERTGHAGPGQVGTTGLRDTGPVDAPQEAPPEQAPGGAEENPVGLPPKAAPPRTGS